MHIRVITIMLMFLDTDCNKFLSKDRLLREALGAFLAQRYDRYQQLKLRRRFRWWKGGGR